MNDLTRLRLLANGGVITSRELAGCGCDANEVRRLVRAGVLVRVRAGAFVDGGRFRAADSAERHRLQTLSVVGRFPGYVPVHVSALVIWGMPILAADLRLIHLAQIGDGRARSAGLVRVHPAVRAADVVPRSGVPTLDLVPAILQVAAQSQRAGLIAADSAIRAGYTTSETLRTAAEQRRASPAAAAVARLASGLAESPGESWTRLVLAGLGVEVEEQSVIRDAEGRVVARVDFLLRSSRVVIEFDGAVKYDGAEGRQALMAEKRREDELRRLGYRVVRLTWADLGDPARVLNLIRQAERLAA